MNKISKMALMLGVMAGVLGTTAVSAGGVAVAAVAVKSDYQNHWAKNEIEWAIQNNLMWKNPDGTFRPDDTITQAQFLASLAAIEKVQGGIPYPPAANHWAKATYEKAAKAGWITPDIKIDPNAKITRYEAAAWITNAWGYKTYDPMYFVKGEHLIKSSYKFVKGIYTPTGKEAFEDEKYFKVTALPTDRFTRAEMAHSLKLIQTRKAYIAEAKGWLNEFYKSIYIKNGMAYGRVPKLPNVTFVKTAGVSYIVTSGKPGRSLPSGQTFSVPAKGKLAIGANFHSSWIMTYHVELPSLRLIDSKDQFYRSQAYWNSVRNVK